MLSRKFITEDSVSVANVKSDYTFKFKAHWTFCRELPDIGD